MKNKMAWMGCLALAGLALPAAGQVVTTFDNGPEGWSVSGRDDISIRVCLVTTATAG